MPSAWVWPARFAIVYGAVLFFLIFLPLLLWQYRRLGRPSVSRLVTIAVFSVYGVAMVSYTILPLPDRATFTCPVARGPFLIPFNSVVELVTEHPHQSLFQIAKSLGFLQIVFNVVFFMPFGLLLRALSRVRLKTATLAGLAASVLIEVTQGTGLYGLYPCAYRVADIDDVLTNTFGAFLGALLAPLAWGLVIDSAQLVASRLDPRRVRVGRRWFGQLLDGVFGFLITVIICGLCLCGNIASWWHISANQSLMIALVGAGLIQVICAAAGGGVTLGQRALWLTWVRWDGSGSSSSARWGQLGDRSDGYEGRTGSFRLNEAESGIVQANRSPCVGAGGASRGTPGVSMAGAPDGQPGQTLSSRRPAWYQAVAAGLLSPGMAALVLGLCSLDTPSRLVTLTWGVLLVLAWSLLGAVTVLLTPSRRGLVGVLTGLDITDSRAEVFSSSAPAAW